MSQPKLDGCVPSMIGGGKKFHWQSTFETLLTENCGQGNWKGIGMWNGREEDTFATSTKSGIQTMKGEHRGREVVKTEYLIKGEVSQGRKYERNCRFQSNKTPRREKRDPSKGNVKHQNEERSCASAKPK